MLLVAAAAAAAAGSCNIAMKIAFICPVRYGFDVKFIGILASKRGVGRHDGARLCSQLRTGQRNEAKNYGRIWTFGEDNIDRENDATFVMRIILILDEIKEPLHSTGAMDLSRSLKNIIV